MAVFETKDGKELIVTCNCSGGYGCGEVARIRVNDAYKEGNIYSFLTYFSGNWAREAGDGIFKTLGRKLKKIWCIIRGKDYYYSDICMSVEDFELFKEYINKF